MKRSLLASTALCAVLAPGAMAADLPTHKAPPPALAPAFAPFTWTGFYIGGNVGGVWTRDSLETNVLSGGTDTLDLSGVVGGVQAGYNYQIQSFVVGIEGDLDWSSAKGSRSGLFFTPALTHSASLPFFADLRGRLGFAFDRFLPYVTGGVVFADVRNTYKDPTVDRGSEATGWAIGGGAEYAIGNHWSVKAEYLYMQFPDEAKTAVLGIPYSFKFKDSAQVARVGLNYRF